jgi:hypothetical protein
MFSSRELFSTNDTEVRGICPGGEAQVGRGKPRQTSRELGTGLTPDKKAACGDRGTGSDASAALAALDEGPELQSCNVTG